MNKLSTHLSVWLLRLELEASWGLQLLPSTDTPVRRLGSSCLSALSASMQLATLRHLGLLGTL